MRTLRNSKLRSLEKPSSFLFPCGRHRVYPGGRGVVLSKRERPKLGGAPLQQAVTPGCPPSSIRSQASCQLPAFGPLELNLSSRLVISSTRDVGTKKGVSSRVRVTHGLKGSSITRFHLCPWFKVCFGYQSTHLLPWSLQVCYKHS